MISIAVAEKRGNELFTLIHGCAARCGLEAVLLRPDTGEKCDVLVMAPSYARKSAILKKLPVACDTVVLPGLCALETAGARQIVSYGLSPRDTLTLSSMNGGNMVAALLREIVNIGGKRLDRQEIVLPPGNGLNPAGLLAALGALLCAGADPVALPQDLFALAGPDA